jgi:beta-lactamase regulating signal transducer with metallopeptidase domain
VSEATLLALFGWIVDATVKGSVVILLVAVLQRLVGRRIGARWSHALWLVVLLRLAVPSGPASSLSIFNLIPLNGGPLPKAAAVLARSAAGGVTLQRQAGSEFVRATAWPAWWRWALALWLFGAVALALRSLIAAIRIHLAVRRAAIRDCVAPEIVEDVKARLGIKRRLRVVESDLVEAPALHGLLQPLLLLPKGFSDSFDRAELRHVVLHELWHLRRMDVAVNWVLAVIQALHWFNPLVWFAASRIREERELACDELALSCLEEDERLGYGRTILKLLERFRAATPIPALVGIVNHKQKMKRRLLMITNYRNRMRFSILFAAAVAIVGVVGLTDARGGERRMVLKELDPAAMATHERMMQRVSLDVTDGSLNDLLTAVSNKTGIVITQSPGTASSPAQDARFTIHAENVPAADVLLMSLRPLGLLPKPEANGLTVFKLVPGEGGPGPAEKRAFLEKHAAEEAHTLEAAHVSEGTIHIAGHANAAEEAHVVAEARAVEEMHVAEGMHNRSAHGGDHTRVRINPADGADAGVVTPEGTLHRNLTFTIEDKNGTAEGHLVLDIKGIKKQ